MVPTKMIPTDDAYRNDAYRNGCEILLGDLHHGKYQPWISIKRKEKKKKKRIQPKSTRLNILQVNKVEQSSCWVPC